MAYDFDTIINRKNTDCLKFDFALQRGLPKDVLPLWVADMDFPTADEILKDLTDRVAHGIFGYTETGDRYFKVVADWLKRKHDVTVRRNWLLKTPGVVYALAMAVKALTKEGDGVLIQRPVYYPFFEVIEDNGRKVVSNDLVLKDGHYEIDFEDFEKKIVEEHVKLFFQCTPHNPVGRVWTREELKKIAEICNRHDVVVASDEIHSDFIYSGHTFTSIINVDEEIKDRLILCTSPAKTFNLAGLQISNIFIPNQQIRRAIRKQIAATGYSQLNTMGIVACESAYTKGETWYREMLSYIEGNLNFLRDYLKEELPKVRLIEPEGTYLVWLDFRALGLTPKELDALIVHRAGLWLDSGAIFGDAGEGFQRINIATSRKVLAEALGRIKKAVDSLEG